MNKKKQFKGNILNEHTNSSNERKNSSNEPKKCLRNS